MPWIARPTKSVLHGPLAIGLARCVSLRGFSIDRPTRCHRAKGLVGLAGLLYWQGDYPRALAN
jgi:hypothetical protein